MSTVVESNVRLYKHEGLEFSEMLLPKIGIDCCVLFIPGMSHSEKFFRNMMQSLALNHGIPSRAVSLEGHGGSDLLGGRTSINQVSPSDYHENIINAIEHCAQDYGKVVVFSHSLSGEYVYDIVYPEESRLPEGCIGLHYCAPVSPAGVLKSATKALLHDAVTSRPLTPLDFGLKLALGDIEGFMKNDPQRTADLFATSRNSGEYRFVGISPKEFCDEYLFAESRQAVINMLLPSPVTPRKINIPSMVSVSTDDKVMDFEDHIDMVHDANSHGDYAMHLKVRSNLCHEMPMDRDYEKVVTDLVELVRRAVSV